jgi:RES domain-containing protein
MSCPASSTLILGAATPIAGRLIARDYAGMLVRSFARGTSPNDTNLVLWKWTKRRPHKVTLFDPNHRLPKST